MIDSIVIKVSDFLQEGQKTLSPIIRSLLNEANRTNNFEDKKSLLFIANKIHNSKGGNHKRKWHNRGARALSEYPNTTYTIYDKPKKTKKKEKV